MCSANQFRRRADGRLLFDTHVRRQDRGRSGFPDHLRCSAERSCRSEHLGVGHAELSVRTVRGALPGRLVERKLVVRLERQHDARSRPVKPSTTSTNANQPGLSTVGPGLCDAQRVRRIRAQQRCATGRGHGRRLACFARHRSDDQPQAALGSSQSAVTIANSSMSSQLTILQARSAILTTSTPLRRPPRSPA